MEVSQESINILRMSLRALDSWVEDTTSRIVFSMNNKHDTILGIKMGIEEKYLRFLLVDGGFSGEHKCIEDFLESLGFMG